jgi:hypothetical protein
MFRRRDVLGGIAGGAMLAGCASGAVTTAGAGAGADAKNSVAPKLFYLGQAKVFTLDAAGGSPITLVDDTPKDGSRATGVNDGIAVNSRTGQIFWTNMGRAAERDGYIMRCERDGSGVTTIVKKGKTFTPKQMKIDEAAGKLYWSDREGMAIQRCNLDGSALETIVSTGSPVQNKGEQRRWCVGIAIDPTRGHVYWTQKGGDNAFEGVIRRTNIQMPAGATAANRSDIVTLFSRMPEPIDLDLDLTTRTMYWTDRGDNTVSRAPMDPKPGYDPATRVDRKILVKGLKEAIGVSLDLPRQRMAYTSLGGEVGIANLDGSEARMLATGQGLLTGIAWA